LVSVVSCSSCGNRNPADANFCASCGASLERATGGDERTITFQPVDPSLASADDEVVVDLSTLPEDTGVLVVRNGPEAGLEVALVKKVTRAGRHPASEIFLDDITVSRRHAEIERTDAGYVLVDVGSLNGTYLNRERTERAPIANGDELQIGKFRLVFLSGPSTDESQ
jgi:pSer/pThr/pTyr-binding forkhead associated (FHA) protein